MLRVGKTPFRNTEFIYRGLEKAGLDEIKFTVAYPPRLGEMLVRDEIDIAPASSIIYARHPDKLLIIPGISISAFGKTNSIIVFSEKFSSLKELDGGRIALPLTSASSVALLEIILAMKEIRTEFVTNQKPDIKAMLESADAGLLIGDDALSAFHRGHRVLADLGDAWRKLTGNGMVYALWLVNRETAREKPGEVREFTKRLYNAREYAYKNIDPVVEEIASEISADSSFLKEHISYLSYNLGDSELNYLREYFRHASEFNVIRQIPELKFFLM